MAIVLNRVKGKDTHKHDYNWVKKEAFLTDVYNDEFYSYSVRIDFSRQNLTSRRQILTTKVDPRTVIKVVIFLMAVDPLT